MGIVADPPHEDMLMFGTIQRSHPTIALGPNADIEQRIIGVAAGRQDLMEMMPIHEGEMNRTGNAILRNTILRKAMYSVSVISPEAIAKSR